MKDNTHNEVILRYNNLHCTVEGEYNAHYLLVDRMAIFTKGAQYSEQFKSLAWDGMKRFYSIKSRKFATGLLRWARDLLTEGGYTVTMVDERARPIMPLRSMEGFTTELRDYQTDIVEKALQATRGVIGVATGGGKTEIALAILHRLHLKSIFLVNSIDLLNQTAERIMKTIPAASVKIIGEGCQRQIGEGVPWLYVATVQTLNIKPELIKGVHFDVKISDECHGVAASTWKKVMDSIDAYYSYGLSGSFDKYHEDEIRYREIIGCTGNPIVKLTASSLVESGHLVKPKIVMLQYDSGVNVDPFKYHVAVKEAITECDIVNKKIIPRLVAKLAGKKVMILVKMLHHGKTLLNRLTSLGINCTFVSGASTGEVRLQGMNGLKTGTLDVLIASNIFNQGVDIPQIDAIINLGCDRAYKNVFQKLGRGLRNAEGKEELLYFDLWPTNSRFLSEASLGRKEKYEYLGFSPVVVDALEYLNIARKAKITSVVGEPRRQPVRSDTKVKSTDKAFWSEAKQQWVELPAKFVKMPVPVIESSMEKLKRLHRQRVEAVAEDRRLALLNKIK